jgi:hypothetical protein
VIKSQAFTLDIKPEVQEKPPTRMQRKMTRIFGSGQATSQIFLTGFMTGAAVGGIFGGLVGCYQAV